MNRGKGKRIAFLAAALGIVVLAGLGVALKALVMERIYIHQLGSKDPYERRCAGERLAEVRSEKAIPHLVTLLKNPDQERGCEAGGPRAAQCENPFPWLGAS